MCTIIGGVTLTGEEEEEEREREREVMGHSLLCGSYDSRRERVFIACMCAKIIHSEV